MFLHITSRIEGRKDDGLLSVMGGNAFPTFLMLDAEGAVIAKHNGPRTIDGFTQTAAGASAFVALRKKAATGDKTAAFDVAVAKAKMGQLDVAGLKAAREAAGELTEQQQTAYKGVLADNMMAEIQRTAIGKAFADMLKAGLIPSPGRARGSFYYNICNYAAYTKDVNLLEKGLAGLRPEWGGNPRYAPYVKSFEKKLEGLKGE